MLKFCSNIAQLSTGKREMIRQLKRLVSEFGAPWVAFKLGYRSPSTIYHWFNNGKVPAMAQVRVKQLIEENKNVKKRS